MGREGGGRAGEEAEEVEGRHRGAGEGAGVARTAVGMRHHPQVARREAAGENHDELMVTMHPTVGSLLIIVVWSLMLN